MYTGNIYAKLLSGHAVYFQMVQEKSMHCEEEREGGRWWGE